MNAKRIGITAIALVCTLALVAVLALATARQEGVHAPRLQPAGGEPAFSAEELAEREAALIATPTRQESEHQRILAIARMQGHSPQRARAIADAAMQARGPSADVAQR